MKAFKNWILIFIALTGVSAAVWALKDSPTQKEFTVKLARLKYQGGGDWYSSRSALENLATYCNSRMGTAIDPEEGLVEAQSSEIFNYPFVFMTGHGNVVFNEEEASNIRKYLESGGFLHICDNYGMDKFVRAQMKKVFPELEFTLVPFSHAIYQKPYPFSQGLPKVHEHDGKAPQGFGLFYKGRLVCFYDYETDLGNGWEDAETYNDPPAIRERALQMGANLISYAFNR